MVRIYWNYIEDTPLGLLEIGVVEEGLVEINFVQEKQHTVEVRELHEMVSNELYAYFRKRLRTFDIPLAFRSGTDFQRTVWRALCTIPYGETISYKELAKRVGNPLAVRAVGGANGRNPIPIIVPCHRVIAHNGGLGGYSGGLEIKRLLLDLERYS